MCKGKQSDQLMTMAQALAAKTKVNSYTVDFEQYPHLLTVMGCVQQAGLEDPKCKLQEAKGKLKKQLYC